MGWRVSGRTGWVAGGRADGRIDDAWAEPLARVRDGCLREGRPRVEGLDGWQKHERGVLPSGKRDGVREGGLTGAGWRTIGREGVRADRRASGLSGGQKVGRQGGRAGRREGVKAGRRTSGRTGRMASRFSKAGSIIQSIALCVRTRNRRRENSFTVRLYIRRAADANRRALPDPNKVSTPVPGNIMRRRWQRQQQ